MKRVLFLLISISFVLLLASCSPKESIEELKDIESEIEEEYIAYSHNGVIINGKEEDIDFFDGDPYSIHSNKINDTLIIKGFDKAAIYHTKYNLIDRTLIKNKLKLDNSKSCSCVYNDSYAAVINHGKDFVDTAYIVDDDFNIDTKILTDIKEEYTNLICNEYGVVFYIYEIEEETPGYYKDNLLKKLVLYKDNEFVEISLDKIFKEDLYLHRKNIGGSDFMIENYFVIETEGKTPYFIYDLEEKKDKTDDKSVYDYINEKLNNDEDLFDYVPKFQGVMKNRDYSDIFNAYCKNATYDFSRSIVVDGVYYYIIATKVDVSYLPWLVRGDTDFQHLPARFIFRYNKKTNDISYVGYSKGDIAFFYTY